MKIPEQFRYFVQLYGVIDYEKYNGPHEFAGVTFNNIEDVDIVIIRDYVKKLLLAKTSNSNLAEIWRSCGPNVRYDIDSHGYLFESILEVAEAFIEKQK